MRLLHTLAAAAFTSVATLANAQQTAPNSSLPIPVQLDQEVQRVSSLNSKDALWPGFDPRTIPLAVFDGRQTFLFRHPSPPAGFKRWGDSTSGTYVRDGRPDEVSANSSAMIGGVLTATIMQIGAQKQMIPEYVAPVAIHEMFHVFQRTRHKAWIANEADLFVYQFEAPQLLTFRRLESDALRRALLTYDATKSACWVRTALKFRADRFARMDSSFAQYERGTEMNEGLAAYVEARSVDRIVEMPANEFAMTEVRQRAYASGSALATLLDRFMPQWKQEFERGTRSSMEQALADGVGSGSVCTFSTWELANASERSHNDANALAEQITKRRNAFATKPGWRLIIESSANEPLFPQGFDPLNVTRLGAQLFLHTRYLKTGNSSGHAEFLNTESLTMSAGAHPINQGFRSVAVAGLKKPEIINKDGVVSIKTPGVAAQFKNATVRQRKTEITVVLRDR